ncbi:MAG: glycosyltransferase [Phycisphaerae bacterium]|nr:glycosyltransferase [Phycisphaerae bacterium]
MTPARSGGEHERLSSDAPRAGHGGRAVRPTLSVVMPNYNHAHCIRRAIEAMGAQSLLPTELIIVDDASTDGSVDVVEQCRARYPFISLIRNATNRGVYETFNRGVQAAAGDFVYGAGADDHVLPGFFEQAMTWAAQYPEVGIIFGKMAAVDTEGRTLEVYGAPGWDEAVYADPQRFLREYLEVKSPAFSLCAATMYRRDAMLEMGGFRPELMSWCDTFLAQSLGLKHGCCYLAQPVVAWSVRPGSLSQSSAADVYRTLDIIERAAWLMRTEPYDTLFPEAFVARWRKAYREQQIGRFVRACESALAEGRNIYWQGLARCDRVERVARGLWMRLAGLLRGGMCASLRKHLNAYKGDLSCFVASAKSPGGMA